ncbi:MAG: PAS domain S-box protein, partial [Pseudomonadota bacterium]
DITGEKRARQQLKGREEQYRAVFNTTTDGMALWTSNGELVDVNPACCALHGMTKEQLLKAELTEFVPPESMPILMNLMANVREGKSYKDEAVATHKDGRVFYLDVRGEPVEFRGEPHILLILRDISEPKQSEQELRKSEDRLRATIEAALDCVVSMDEQGRIIEFNPAAEKTFGYRRSDVLGKPLAETIVPEQYRARHHAGMQRYLETGEGSFLGRRIELSALRADGTTFPMEIAIDVANGVEGKIFISYIRDITERKQAEEERTRLETQLRQAQKMEAIGHLTGGIAHDFNNILTGIMGYVVMAQEWEERHKDDKLQRYLERAQKSGQRARDLIQQMLTFSRGQRGEPRALSMRPYIKESVKLLDSSLPSSIEISVNCADNVPRVMIDPVHIGQVLMNLCINARDAMDGNGQLEIGLRQVSCDSSCICASCHKPLTGDYVEVWVRDTGPGMAPEVVDRIFEPFFSTKEVGKGSGMGLSTVHGIVHEYSGHILVESRPGHSAKFSVMLPVSNHVPPGQDEADADIRSAILDKGLAGDILVVEDDNNVSEYMQDRLEDWGLNVTMCANGVEALARHALRDRPYDVYIVDYIMPKMNGLELSEKILAQHPRARIVMYTGYSENLSEKDVVAKGVYALMRKPVNDDALYDMLDKLLHKAH